MSDKESLLEVENLKLHFPFRDGGVFSGKKGAIRAVDGVSFKVQKGETLGLAGESGCGKSTTARAIAQLYKPTAGKVLFKGNDLVTATDDQLMRARKDMQMVFQDPYASLNPRMTAGDIIAEPFRVFNSRKITSYSRSEITERVESSMDRVGLSRFFRNRYPP